MTPSKSHIPRKTSTSPDLSDKLKQTLASLHLEGIKLSKKALHDLQELEAGRLSEKEYLARAIQRAKA